MMTREQQAQDNCLPEASGTTIELGSVRCCSPTHTRRPTYCVRALRGGERWLEIWLGVEAKGIDRITEEERRPPSIWNAFFIWWSLNIHVGNLPIGVLGLELGLSLRAAISATLIGTAIGALCPAITGSLGPKLGLRQIAIARYSFGYHGAKLCSALNLIVGGGFAVVNYVVVGQMLSAVSGYKINITAGIVIVTTVSYLISFFGFHVIHAFERYSWLPFLILLLVLVGQAAPHIVVDMPGSGSGRVFSGAFLTVLAINFSNASGWCVLAADYYCHYPASTRPWKIFLSTWSGIFISCSGVVIIGSCLANAYMSYEPWLLVYRHHFLGGLIGTIFQPSGFSKFAVTLLTFSVVGNDVAIIYSSGLSIQLLGDFFHTVPRLIWSLIFTAVVTTLAVAGREHLSELVNDFVSLLGYWTVSFTIILLMEDRVFRRRQGYDLMAWDQSGKLPWGVAAVTALLAGYLVGGLTGMDQTFYVGCIAKKIGPDGGDVGIWLSLVITTFWYACARSVEQAIRARRT